MALKDCIKKLGVVSPEDRALLKQYIDEGLTDKQAVRRLLIESSVDIIDIADRARQAGAEVAVPADKVGEIRSLQDKRLRKAMARRAELEDAIAASNAEYRDMSQNAELFDQIVQRKMPSIDSMDFLEESEAIMAISQVMFDQNVRSGFERGVLGVQGTTPREVYRSWQAERDKRVANRKAHGKLIEEHNTVSTQVKQIISDSGRFPILQQFDQTVFHGSPHAFEEFSMEAIGTGEGVQAYGYGLYFAESRDVASFYTASNDTASIVANSVMVKFKNDRDAAIEHLTSGKSGYNKQFANRAAKILQNKAEVLGGHVYEVEIDDAAVENMLEYDKPVGDAMAEKVIKAYGKVTTAKTDNGYAVTIVGKDGVGSVDHATLAATPKDAMLNFERQTRLMKGENLYRHLSKLLGSDSMASEALLAAGIPGIKFLDQKSRTTSMQRGGGFLQGLAELGKKQTSNMVLFDTSPILEVKRDGEVVYQRDQTFEQSKRGSITFDEARKATINLYQAADFSTFIHEAGHLYLELMGTMAESLGATEQVLRDWQTILNYLGVKDRSEITTEHHELWARSFEKYAMDGKAPSITLQDAFNAFRRWLGEIYKRIAGVRDIELPSDIRDVMDRILATDIEIQQAENRQEFAALFTSAEQMGVSEEVFEVYKNALIRAHDEAVQKETVKLLAEMKRDEQAWYKEEAKKVEAEVAAEVHRLKVYQAYFMLTQGKYPDGSPTRMAPFKLDRDSLLDLYQGDTKSLKLLPHTGAHGIYRRKDGVDVDVAAQRLGYVDGRALIEALLKAPPMEDVIKAETMRRMEMTYPDPFKDGTLAENAVRQVHNQRRAEVLAAEMRQLRALKKRDKPIVRATEKAAARETRQAREANRGILPKRAELAMIKEGARQAIGLKRLRDVSPQSYLNGERKAGRLAFEAAAKGDYQKAFLHKRQQLINHEMYRAAVQAKERSAKTQKYLTKFESKRVQQRLGRSDVLDKILAVLEGVDFRKRSLKAIDRQKLEKELARAVDESELVMPPGVLDRIFDERVNWQELTVDELEAMRDLIKQLEKQAKADVEAIVNGEKVLLEQKGGEIAEQLYDNHKVIDFGVGEKTRGQRTGKALRQGVGAWLRPSSIARVLDKAGFGAVTRNVIVPMRRAYSERLIPGLHKAQSDVAKIYRAHFDNETLRILQKKRFRIEAQNETYSHADLLSLALNWGNEGNRAAIRDGKKRNGQPAFTEAGVKQMLAQLTEADWQFVQEVWDYLESYWPDLQAAEQRRRGIAPKRIEPSPFSIRTADGKEVTLRGGYLTLKYASEHSDRTRMQQYQDYYKNMQNGVYVTASTRAGSTYERSKSGGQVVRLSLNVLDNHLREIVRDIAIGDEVNYLKRLLANKDVRNAFHETGNETALDTLNLWLTDAAVGELPAEGFWEQTAAWIRTGFTKSKLGWNLMTMMLQFTGWAQSAAVIGSKHMAIGLAKFIRNPQAMWVEVMEKSQFLETRYSIGAWDKDVQDTKAHLESFFGPQPTRLKVSMNYAAHTYFLPIAKAQQVVDITTWLGAYEKGLNELNLSDADAVLYADTQVEGSQTSGFFSDRSGLERGTLGMRKNRQSQYIRIWTTLISYMLAKGNIAYEKTRNTNFRSPAQVAAYAGDMILLFTVEGIASALLYGNLPEDDDAEDLVAWTAKATLESVWSGVPFVREVPGSRFAGGNTPIGSFAKDLYSLGVQLEQGENDAAARKALYNSMGTAFHLPMSQVGRTLEAIWFEDDPEWWEYISGVKDD